MMLGHFDSKKEVFKDIVTCNTEMLSIFKYVESISKTSHAVLITGETGVGKKMLARTIHAARGRSGPWVPIHAGEMDDESFSTVVFGRVDRGEYFPGKIQMAQEGALLIEEIGIMGPLSQNDLLKYLEDSRFLPLERRIPTPPDVQIMATASTDLWGLQRTGRFRKKLNLKLRSHHIHVPALRERTEDIPLLINHFLQEAARSMNKKRPTPPKELYTLLQTYSFPGNVKELREMIFEAVRRHKAKVLSLDVFKKQIERGHKKNCDIFELDPDESSPFKSLRELPTIKEFTQMLVQEAMKRANQNQSIAARMLGISQPALSKRLKKNSR